MLSSGSEVGSGGGPSEAERKKKVSRRKFIYYTIGGVAAVAVIGTSGYVYSRYQAGQGANNPIKIGMPAPLSGADAADGQDSVRGATMAIDKINAAGGLMGRPLQLVTSDSGALDPESVTSAMTKVVDSNVSVIMSPFASLTNFEIDLAQQAGIMYYISANSQITQKKYTGADLQKYWMIFSPEPPVDSYGTRLPQLLTNWQQAGLMPTGKGVTRNTVYMFTTQNSYSQEIHDVLKNTLTQAGFTITGDDFAPEGDIADFSALLAKIRENPPYLFLSTDWRPGNHANFIKQFVQNPTNSYVYQQYGPSVASYIQIAGDAATGVFWSTIIGLINTPKYPVGAQFYTDFKTKWGNAPSWAYASTMYDNIFMWVQAVQKAGSLSQRAVATAQESSQYQGLDGLYAFDQYHIAKAGPNYLPTLYYQIWKQQYVFVDPTTWSVTGLQVPPWMKTQ